MWKTLVSYLRAGKAQGRCSYGDDGGLEGCGLEASEPGARRSDCLQPRAPFICEHDMQAYECVQCKVAAAACHNKDPAFYTLVSSNTSPFASPRERLSPDTAPPCAVHEAANKTMRTDIAIWCPGEEPGLPAYDILAPCSETTDSSAPPTLPAPPTTTTATTTLPLLNSNVSSGHSSSTCSSNLHDLLQGGSRSSLLSATTTTSSSDAAPFRTEVQLLASQLAEREQQLRQASQHVKDLVAKNALLCSENRGLRRALHELQERQWELEDSLLHKGAKLARMAATSKRLVREVKDLKRKLEQLQATASAPPTTCPRTTTPPTASTPTTRTASPTTSPPTNSLRTLEELVLQAQGEIAEATQRQACSLIGMTPGRQQLAGTPTDPSKPNPSSNVALIQAKEFIDPKSGKKIMILGTPSVWLMVDNNQRVVKMYVAKVRPFHSAQRIQELLRGTFSPASTGSGIRSPVLVPWEKASTELVTTTAMDRAARHHTPGAHGPFLAPLDWFVRPCSQVGGPLDVGHDMELVVVYEYCAGGDARGVVRRAVEAVLRRGGSVAEAAAAGAAVARKALAASLLLLQQAHDMGYILSDHKAENMVYHPDLGWILIDSEGAVLCGPDGRVPGHGIYTPDCAAPEQKAAKDPWRGVESDMWATGALAQALLGEVEEACREAAKKEYASDRWEAKMREDMGEARTTLLTLAGVCCLESLAVRATLQDARKLMGV